MANGQIKCYSHNSSKLASCCKFARTHIHNKYLVISTNQKNPKIPKTKNANFKTKCETLTRKSTQNFLQTEHKHKLESQIHLSRIYGTNHQLKHEHAPIIQQLTQTPPKITNNQISEPLPLIYPSRNHRKKKKKTPYQERIPIIHNIDEDLRYRDHRTSIKKKTPDHLRRIDCRISW